jgi:N-acetylglucosaminyldiphosphoundecaprenol N-acetyl-beta-D-mannosaminyltransferase
MKSVLPRKPLASAPQKFNLLGVRVSTFDLASAVTAAAEAVAADRRVYASTCPVYTLMLGHERADVRHALNEAEWVTPDGMPVVWALRWLGARDVGRVYGPDLMAALTKVSTVHGYRQFYLGGQPGVAENLAAVMQARFPGLVVAGTASPPFRQLSDVEQLNMLAQINAAEPHIVWVGLGSPKQDLWMAQNRPLLTAPLLVGVGAAFDFLTGGQPQAPLWMQRSGLEWLFRLVAEPRRLWRRYLIYNPKFIFHLTLQLSGLRRYGEGVGHNWP